jgi:hypothetical protein
MRHLGVGLLATGALVLVAACGGTVHPAAQNLTTAPATTSASAGGPAMGGPELPPGSVPVSGSRVDASALPADYPREVWTAGDGSEIGLYGEAGGCQTITAQVVGQTATQVTVQLLQIQQKPNTRHTVCALNRMLKPLTAQLDAPLGSRTVLLRLTVQEG